MGSTVLIIGGTGFIGRHLVDACLDRGHEVTLFNRDRRPGRPRDLAHIVGDRRRPEPTSLATGWDIVIDTCAYAAPDMAVSRLIATHRYVLLSTCGVYQGGVAKEITGEDAPVDPDGPAAGKLDCERLAADLPGELLVVRLGVVTGPGDTSGRLTYWVERCLRGHDVLVPASRDQPVQLVDVRDVATVLASAVESDVSGVINIAGPVTSFENLLHLVVAATGSRSPLRWVLEHVALAHGVRPWHQVPLWLTTDSAYRAHLRVGSGRAHDIGFRPRTIAETVQDTVRWYRANRAWHTGWLPEHVEREILTGLGEPS